MSADTEVRPLLAPPERRAVEDPSPRPVRHVLRDHWLGAVLVALLIGGAAMLHGTNLGGYPAPSIDEGTYTSQAWSVLTRGELAPYTYWYDHPPLGWLLLAGGLGLSGGLARAANVVLAGREVALAFHLASCGLLYVWARRLQLRRGFAALAVLLYTVSPLTVFFARQVLLDNLAVPLLIGALALAASPRRRLFSGAGAGLLFGLACLTKETLLLVLPAVAWQVWCSTRPGIRRYSMMLAATLFGLTVGAYLLLAALRGELLPGPGHVSLWDGVAYQLVTRHGTPPLVQGGTAQLNTVARWLTLDPWLLAGGCAAALPAAVVRRLRPAVAALVLLALGGAITGYLPAMYVIALLPFAALLVAGVLDRLWGVRLVVVLRRSVPRALRRPLAPAALAAVAALGWVVGPSWAGGLERPLTRAEDAPQNAAFAWIADNVEPGARLLVDEPLRIELVVNGGFPEEDVVWIYKLDLDPEVAAANPFGWRDFDYVVTTASSRGDANLGPEVSAAMRESTLVASFSPPGQAEGGEALVPGQDLIEIRAIERLGAPPRVTQAPEDRQAPPLTGSVTAPGAGVSVVLDNRGLLWLIDPRAQSRAEMDVPQLTAAQERYGQIRYLEPSGEPIMLTGWRERSFAEIYSP